MTEYTKLFEPIRIGGLELKNRIVMPALCSKFGTEFGAVSQRLIDFYVERARGGVGLIIIENTCVDWPVGKAGTNPIRADDWKFVQGLHDLADAVHPYGARIATQLQHTGRQGSSMTSAEGQELVAPSPIPCLPTGAEMPRELTPAEIEVLIGKFILGASITKAAGFDAVEIQAGHGYLINQFMSPYSNKREDDWGGSFDNRMRFAIGIVEGVRLAVGSDFPIIVRLSGDEHIDGGLTIEDMKLVAKRLESVGVDAVSVSAGIYESPPWYSRIFPTMGMPEGCNVPLSEEIKKAVKVPVIVAGKLGSASLAESVLAEGKADLVAMGRPLLADPEIPNKVALGKADEVRPCIYCNEACAGNISQMWRIECVVNPALGRERECRIEPARRAKRVVVVGGGPGGMEAARVAALRGHDVVLYERQDRLGGQLLAASVPGFKKPLSNLLDYLRNQVDKGRVKVQLGNEATPDMIKAAAPEVVVLATGASHAIPDLRGADGRNVATACDVLLGTCECGSSVAVVGGGEVGCELAWFLAERGNKVTIVEMALGLAMDVNLFSRFYLLEKLAELGVSMLPMTTAKEIVASGVSVANASGDTQLIEADTVVLATGFSPNTGLEEAALGGGVEVYSIGDCVQPGKVRGAVHAAWRVAMRI